MRFLLSCGFRVLRWQPTSRSGFVRAGVRPYAPKERVCHYTRLFAGKTDAGFGAW